LKAGVKAMARSQVNGYVLPAERRAFEAYAARFGLDVATLLLLLLIRELRVRRLESLRARYDAASLAQKEKVTAHIKVDAIKQSVTNLARDSGLSESRLCAILVRTELAETWFESALSA
jgi:hypothetical protein